MNASLKRAYHYHRLRRLVSNYSLLRARHCDGWIASMHQAGTHWLKFMLAQALAQRYGVAPPRYNHANDIIGGPKDPVQHPQLPLLRSAHSLPAWPLYSALLYRRLGLPPFVVLVRDPRASLVSNYNKWQARYGQAFSDYLRGDPAGHRYNSDIWWCIRFMNAWGALAAAQPATVLVLHYEAVQADPAAALARVDAHLQLDLGAGALAHGVAAASKSRMQAQHDPQRPPGEVRQAGRPWQSWYASADRAFVEDVARELLHFDFGYALSRWPASEA